MGAASLALFAVGRLCLPVHGPRLYRHHSCYQQRVYAVVFLRCWSLIARESLCRKTIHVVIAPTSLLLSTTSVCSGFLAVFESHCTRELVSQNDSRRDCPYITLVIHNECMQWFSCGVGVSLHARACVAKRFTSGSPLHHSCYPQRVYAVVFLRCWSLIARESLCRKTIHVGIA